MYCYTNSELTQVKGKILFLGDSITNDGRFVSFLECWLRLYYKGSDISLYNLGVSSETLSGLSEPDHPFPRPCGLSRIERALNSITPDWIVLYYGINDGIYYPFSEERFNAFKNGYLKAVEIIKRVCPNTKIVVLTPTPFDGFSFEKSGNTLADDAQEKYSFMSVYKDYNKVMKAYAEWIMSSLANNVDLAIDIYSPLFADIQEQRKENSEYVSGDGIHPNRHGHYVIAKTILASMFGVEQTSGEEMLSQDDFSYFEAIHKISTLRHERIKEQIGHDNPYKSDILSNNDFWLQVNLSEKEAEKLLLACPSLVHRVVIDKGFKRHTLFFEGFEVIVDEPECPANSRPWIWRTEFFGAFPYADDDLRAKGWHIVNIKISHLFGSPLAVSIMNSFFDYIKHQFSLLNKAALFGFSRGGLYALYFAAKYPQKVSGLYLDAPVIDITSWPGGKNYSEWDFTRAKKAFNLKDETLVGYNAIMHSALNSIVENKLPTILVAGDSDTVVPFNENGILVKDVYEKTHIPFNCILKPGVDHHPHSLSDPSPITDFIIKTMHP